MSMSGDLQRAVELIKNNRESHDLVAPLYESRHEEIFNKIEQQRIHELLESAIKNIWTGSEILRVLDFGAGTGNLTRQLLNLGVDVVAADVSSGCLRELKSLSRKSERMQLSLLNGHDLSQFADESFDMVVTYSVLHHVPDYLAIVREFVRVVKPGGIVYIDHEVCPAYWENRPEYQIYCREVEELRSTQPDTFLQRVSNIARQDSWWRYLSTALRMRWNKDFDEGDIHVTPDDHIEWPRIRRCLESHCEILHEDDYLVCRERTIPAPAWDKWRSQCVDMRLIVAMKL